MSRRCDQAPSSRVWLLAAAMMCAWLPAAVSAETIKLGGTGAAMRTMQILAEPFERSHPSVTITMVPGLGSRGGTKALLAGMKTSR